MDVLVVISAPEDGKRVLFVSKTPVHVFVSKTPVCIMP